MNQLRRTTLWALVGTALLLVPGSLQGQLVLEGHGGVAVPVGDLGSFEDTGASLGVAVGWHLSPRFEVRIDGGSNFYNEQVNQATGAEIPDLQMYHYEAGVDYELTSAEGSRWDLSVNAQGGLTTVDTDTIRPGPTLADFTQTYPSLAAGLKAGYDVSEEARPHIEFYVGGVARFVFSDEQDTRRFAPFSADFPAEGTTSLINFPLEAGVALHF